MKISESDCVDCGLPCMYKACPHYEVVRYICDNCKDDVYELYHFEGQELCGDCVLEQLEKVE